MLMIPFEDAVRLPISFPELRGRSDSTFILKRALLWSIPAVESDLTKRMFAVGVIAERLDAVEKSGALTDVTIRDI